MSASARLPPMDTVVKPMTQTEFLDWAQTQEGRYEFDGFQPVAMTGGTGNHGRISRNLITLLTTKLRGSPCEPERLRRPRRQHHRQQNPLPGSRRYLHPVRRSGSSPAKSGRGL